jgi:lipopolysaccharide export LptBFGC system permease protein LptF
LSSDGGKGLRKLARKAKYMDLGMLLGRICLTQENGENATPLLVELHTRMSMSLSPIAFLLVGIPFAVRGRRSETSVGLLMALLLALGFYAFLLVSRSLKHDASAHPQVLIWLPNLLYQAGGLWALAFLGRH